MRKYFFGNFERFDDELDMLKKLKTLVIWKKEFLDSLPQFKLIDVQYNVRHFASDMTGNLTESKAVAIKICIEGPDNYQEFKLKPLGEDD